MSLTELPMYNWIFINRVLFFRRKYPLFPKLIEMVISDSKEQFYYNKYFEMYYIREFYISFVKNNILF